MKMMNCRIIINEKLNVKNTLSFLVLEGIKIGKFEKIYREC